MLYSRKIQEEINDLVSLNSLVTAYQEVAALRMQGIRGDVLSQRVFANELSRLYAEIKDIYRQEIKKLLNREHIDNPSLLFRKNGKTLYILLSANTGFYGDIIQKTFNQFVKDTQKRQNIDVAVVGEVGNDMLLQIGFKKQFTYFDVPDQKIDSPQYAKLLEFLLSYERVLIYHGLFKSLITQEAVVTGLDEPQTEEETVEDIHVKVKWLVDPNLNKVLTFFENEMLSNVFLYTFDESQMAKLASRIFALEDATENIKKSIHKSLLLSERFSHMQENKEQLNMLSGRRLWKKRI